MELSECILEKTPGIQEPPQNLPPINQGNGPGQRCCTN